MSSVVTRLVNTAKLTPYLPLIPWIIMAIISASIWAGVHYVLYHPLAKTLYRLTTEETTIRQKYTQRQEAMDIGKDLGRVLTMLPTMRDFAQLPMFISEEASRSGVTLPGITYTYEKSDSGLGLKVLFKGQVTGRYVDLRRFIYQLETSDRLLFIEDITVARLGARSQGQGDVVTVDFSLATYLRQDVVKPSPAALRASAE